MERLTDAKRDAEEIQLHQQEITQIFKILIYANMRPQKHIFNVM
jgi:hypothetical protein